VSLTPARRGWESIDAVVALLIATLLCVTVWPICKYHGLILLQAMPDNKHGEIEKLLREVRDARAIRTIPCSRSGGRQIATLDGVLEVREEHFWLHTYSTVVGTLHVRVRRDANEQVGVSFRVFFASLVLISVCVCVCVCVSSVRVRVIAQTVLVAIRERMAPVAGDMTVQIVRD
jgi:Co/Zn/Cd efflux system component